MSADQNRNAKHTTWDSLIGSFYFAVTYAGMLGILDEVGIGRISLSYALLLAIGGRCGLAVGFNDEAWKCEE